VFFFCTTPVARSTEFHYIQRGIKLYIPLVISSAYSCHPATLAVVKTCYSTQLRDKHGKSGNGQQAQRLGLPAFTGPTCQFEIPSLIGGLVSSLVSLRSPFGLPMRVLSPDAKVSLIPWKFPLWEHFYHTTIYHGSQEERKFQTGLLQDRKYDTCL
jgi:hypothetical protein